MLKGWKQIAKFLGEPVSVVERWATTTRSQRASAGLAARAARQAAPLGDLPASRAHGRRGARLPLSWREQLGARRVRVPG